MHFEEMSLRSQNTKAGNFRGRFKVYFLYSNVKKYSFVKIIF